MTKTQPNILFIMTDQLRRDALGCTGNWVKTPHLDRLAAAGMRFDHCVTNSPVCVPARCSLATGLYPHNTGVWDNQDYDLAPETPTWMQAIREAGYRTSLFGKTHLHHHSGDLRDREYLLHAYGLDDVDEIGGPRASARVGSHMTARWEQLGLWEAYRADYKERFATKPHLVRPSSLPLEEYADVYVGRTAREYLTAYDRDQPWFCWVSFGGPHEPWDCPEPYASLYRPQDMPLPLPRLRDPSPRPDGELDQRFRKQQPLAPADVAAMRADYAGNVSLIDEQIGELLKVLEARDERENTLILFWSDHGEFNGDHGLIYKSAFLDPAVRVPLIVQGPGVRTGVCAEMTEGIDIGPTLAEAAGATLAHRQFGRSLLPLLRGETDHHRPFAVCEHAGEMMYLDADWKLGVNAKGESYLLFDRKADPQEQVNRVGDPALRPQIAELRDRLFQHLLCHQLQ